MRLMVVDDEHEIRDYIANMPEWKAIGCEVVGKAANGAEALEQIASVQPDAVITDIMMPVMDGIELTRRIRQLWPGMPVVFLTAYHEFEYAREAVKLGVSDFITKPFQPGDLTHCVELLRIPDRQMQSLIEQDEMFALFSHPDTSDAQMRQWLLDNRYEDRPFVLLYVDTDNHQAMHGIHRPFRNLWLRRTIGAVIDRRRGCYWTAFSENGIYFLVFSLEGDEDNLLAATMGLARDIMAVADDAEPFSLSVCVSQPLSSLLKLREAVRQISRCLEYRMLLGRKSVIAFDALEKLLAERKAEISLSLGEVEDLLRQADEDGIVELVRNAYRRLLSTGTGKKEIQHYCISLIEKAESVLAGFGIDVPADSKVEIREAFLSQQFLTDMMQRLEKQLCLYARMVVGKLEDASSWFVAETKRIIENEYHQDISLRAIAERLNVNYSYLSRIIKKATGQNFSDLLWLRRIEAAKTRLANEDVKAYEVAYDVGFKDAAHFSFLFKKVTGLTPTEYKMRLHSRQGQPDDQTKQRNGKLQLSQSPDAGFMLDLSSK